MALDMTVTIAVRPDLSSAVSMSLNTRQAATVARERKMRSIRYLAREASFSFKALSVTSLGFWDLVAEKQIMMLCRAKSTRLGLRDASVTACSESSQHPSARSSQQDLEQRFAFGR